jgi:hypothetical protein
MCVGSRLGPTRCIDTFLPGGSRLLGPLPVDVGGVVPHRFLRDVQRTSYLPITHTLCQGPYHLELPLGERRGSEVRTSGPAALEGIEHLLGELWGDYGIPGVDLTPPADQRDDSGHVAALNMAGHHTSCMPASRALDILQCSSSVPFVLSHQALTRRADSKR